MTSPSRTEPDSTDDLTADVTDPPAGRVPYSDVPCGRCGWLLRTDGTCTRCRVRVEPLAPLTRVERLYLAVRALGLSGVEETTNHPAWRSRLVALYADDRTASLPELRSRLAAEASRWKANGCPV